MFISLVYNRFVDNLIRRQPDSSTNGPIRRHIWPIRRQLPDSSTSMCNREYRFVDIIPIRRHYTYLILPIRRQPEDGYLYMS